MSTKNDGIDTKRKMAMDAEHMVPDAELDAALRNFRLSAHAWSEAAYSRPRQVASAAMHHSAWRAATGWALGCVLVAGAVSGGVFERQRHLEQERAAAAAKIAEQQREASAEARANAAKMDEDALLAHVNSDVSRQVPAAMDTLASLVDGDNGN